MLGQFACSKLIAQKTISEIYLEVDALLARPNSIEDIDRIFKITDILIDSAAYEQLVHLYEHALKQSFALDYEDGRLMALFKLASEYKEIGDYGKAMEMSDSLLHQQGVPDSLRRQALLTIGISSSVHSQYDRAIQALENAMTIPGRLADDMEVFDYLSYSHSGLGDYESAITYCLEALELLDKAAPSSYHYLSQFNHNIALIHLKNEDDEEAIRYYRLALQHNYQYEKAGDPLAVVQDVSRYARSKRVPILIERGLAFGKLRSYDSAKQSYRKARILTEQLGGRNQAIREAVIAINIAHLDNELEKYQAALKELERVEEYFREGELENFAQHVSFLITKSTSLRGLGQLARALEVLLLAESKAHELDLQDENTIMDLYESISSTFEEAGDYKKALEYDQRAHRHRDSIYTREKLNVIKELQTKYETAQKEKEIMLFERKEAKLRSQLHLTLIGLVVFVLFGTLSFRFYQVKRRDNKRLDEQNREIRSLSTFKQSLTHMFAHDLKNSLSTVLSASKSRDRAKMSDIEHTGHFALNLVNNMLDVQKFEEAKMQLKVDSFRLLDLVNDAYQQLGHWIESKSIQLNTVVADQIVLKVDRALVVRMIVNLLHNAIKYSSYGEPIEVFALHGTTGSEEVTVMIKDYGRGIDKMAVPKVFDKYWYGGDGLQDVATSTGLGLTFCKLVIEAHGGSIAVESVLGEYTQVTLTFQGAEAVPDSHHKEVQLLKESVESATLNQEERELILSSTPELKALRVYQVSHLRRVLQRIDDLGINEVWKKKLHFAIRECNEEVFHQALEQL